MSAPITVTLPDDVLAAISDASRQEGLSPDEIVGRAVKIDLFLRRFHALREKMVPEARSRGIITDEDVFERVS